MREIAMPKGFDLRRGAGKTVRVWVQGKGGALRPGQARQLPRSREKPIEAVLTYDAAPRRAVGCGPLYTRQLQLGQEERMKPGRTQQRGRYCEGGGKCSIPRLSAL